MKYAMMQESMQQILRLQGENSDTKNMLLFLEIWNELPLGHTAARDTTS